MGVVGSLPEKVDLAVIGGGVGGYVAAIRAAQLGMSVTLIEKNKLGGNCLNYACIPSKTLIHVADLFYDLQHSQKFGVNVGSAELDAKTMFQWRSDVSEKLEKGVGFLCKANQIEVIKGSAAFSSPSTLQLSDGTSIEFKKAIIATGSEPISFKDFAFGGNILDYKQALSLNKIPSSMLVIGAGYVGVELSMLYAKLGTKVTISARSDVLSHFDADATELVKKRMKELGMNIRTGITQLSRNGDEVSLSDGSSIKPEVIVIAIGLSPYTKDLGLENTAVKLDDQGFIAVNEQLKTAEPNIFAIGDVAGGPLLAHKAMRQGVIAAEVASGMPSIYDSVVPAVVFSEPEIAIVGTLDEAQGLRITKFPLGALGIGIAFAKTNGFVKVAYDKNNVVKGMEIVSHNANVMIAEATLAIEMGATLEDIADTIHAHPTFSEAIEEVTEGALGRGIHFFYGKNTSIDKAD